METISLWCHKYPSTEVPTHKLRINQNHKHLMTSTSQASQKKIQDLAKYTISHKKT